MRNLKHLNVSRGEFADASKSVSSPSSADAADRPVTGRSVCCRYRLSRFENLRTLNVSHTKFDGS
ncbi:hypothetical protein NL492_26515, partial [Klebsiella pneumoniae]|nr:hypothetical protein [Klebsiella pneumoniae]